MAYNHSVKAYLVHIKLITLLFFLYVSFTHWYLEMTAASVKSFTLLCYKSFKEDVALHQYNLGHCYLYSQSLMVVGNNANNSKLLPTDLITVR